MSSDASQPSAPAESPSLAETTSQEQPLSPAPDAESTSAPRMRIGSQRVSPPEKLKPKPVAAATAKPQAEPQIQPQVVRTPKKYPPPNTRGQLSPELEVEFAEALAGMSMDEVLAGGSESGEAELEPESKHMGRVISVHRDNLFVELGGRKTGVLPMRMFEVLPEIGATLPVMVSRFNAAEGLYELVLPGAAVTVADWSEITEGMIVEARVTGHNKGGLECEVNRIRAFIPAGQASLYRIEDLSQLVGEKFACVVTEANPAKGNLILSRRAVLEREKAEAKENLLASLETGQVREGVVRSLQSFGAFVDIGGIDGLIHISQLSWDRIKHADEVLEVGQKVKVKVQKIDPETGKIGLGFRDLAENPWAAAATKFPVRSRVKGTVTRIMEFGVFVRLEPGIEGLVHISELSHKRVWRAADLVAEGQEVEAVVLAVDAEQQRISLSMKALEARAAPAKEEESADEQPDAAPATGPAKSKKPLKGGIAGGTGGEKFGLKW